MKLPTRTFLAVIIVNLLATTGDTTLSWTSPVYPKLYSNNSNINPLDKPITEEEDAFLGSLLNLGAIIGSFPLAYLCDKIGRKITLLLIAVPHIMSFLILAYAKNIYLYYAARLLGGIAVGGGYTVIPTYIAEISRDKNRGAMSLSLNIFWAVGNFIPYAIGPYMSIESFNIALVGIPVTFFVIFLIIGPESPYYQIQKGNLQDAERTLLLLRSNDCEQVKKDVLNIEEHLEMNEDGKLLDILKDKYIVKALVICSVLVCTQELSGFCAITFHLQSIFESAGTDVSSDISALIVGSALLLTSCLSPFIVDKIGRRFLVISSCFGMCVAHILIGIFFYLQDCNYEVHKSLQFLPIFSLILYIFSFNLGICCIPWTLLSELFPNHVKKITSSLASSLCWITSFIMTSTFNSMNDAMGRSGPFWLFAGFCFASGVFSVLFVPETKGKSFVEIQRMLRYGSVLSLKSNRNDDKEYEIGLNS